jgi:hypothetical protein
VPGWFEEQLGLVYRGLSGLPENWVLNTGDEDNPIRRAVSTFLSPLATGYVLVPSQDTTSPARICPSSIRLAKRGGSVPRNALKTGSSSSIASQGSCAVGRRNNRHKRAPETCAI